MTAASGGPRLKKRGPARIGLADAAGCEVTEHRIGNFLTREEIRDRARKTALNRLRLLLVRM